MTDPLRLITPHLVLRSFRTEELQHFRRFMKNETATEYLLFSPEQKTDEGVEALFQEIVGAYDSVSPALAFAIADKATDKYIGTTGLCEDFNSNIPQLFWYIEQNYRNSGYAIEAIKKLMEYAFRELHIQKIATYIKPENAEYIQIAKKAGMDEGGLLHSKATNFEALYFYKEVV